MLSSELHHIQSFQLQPALLAGECTMGQFPRSFSLAHSDTQAMTSVRSAIRNRTADSLTFDQFSLYAHQDSAYMGMTTLGSALYIAGGYNGTEHLNTVERYDLELETWITCAPMNKARSAFGLVAYNDCLYACGGFQPIISIISRNNTRSMMTPGNLLHL